MPAQRPSLLACAASAAAALLAVVPACDCAGPEAPPGTTSYACTCECGVFVVGQPIDELTRHTPRFDVCLTPDDLEGRGRLFAQDVVELCDDACRGPIAEAVRVVACVDRPDLCDEAACKQDLCRVATPNPRDVFVPAIDDAGVVQEVPDDALLSFGFAAACRDPAPDGGVLPCDEVPCALDDVRAIATCGDGVLQQGEDCDGACTTFASCAVLAPGTRGVVTCDEDCAFDASGCVPDDEEPPAAPVRDDCAEENDARLQEKVLTVLRTCTLVTPPASDACPAREAAPLCLVP